MTWDVARGLAPTSTVSPPSLVPSSIAQLLMSQCRESVCSFVISEHARLAAITRRLLLP